MPADREIERFLERHGAAFARYDVTVIADMCAYPAHLTNDVGRGRRWSPILL